MKIMIVQALIITMLSENCCDQNWYMGFFVQKCNSASCFFSTVGSSPVDNEKHVHAYVCVA